MRRNGTVLLVNSFDGREMYAEYLRHRDLTVVPAARPEDAFSLLETARPDVIVTDSVFLASRFDGPGFIRTLRERPASAVIPVIVISGYVREEDRRAARHAGADRYLLKPLLPEALYGEIANALQARARGQRMAWNWSEASLDRRREDRRRRERRHAHDVDTVS